MAKPAKKAQAKKPSKAKPEAKAEPKPKAAVKLKAKPKVRKAARRAAALPMPPGLPRPAIPAPAPTDPAASAMAPFTVADADAGVLDALWRTVEARRLAGDVEHSHSARLIARGTAKVAQKLGEEAVECVIEATQGNRGATVLESADLLYHLVVLWVDAGIRPEEVWAELARRQGISGIAEKAARPKGIVRAAQTSKLP
ncbi:MAG: phosphoribosyl-ATP diphosphatase [Roseomonas sp.]|nr:phosphoribosyl-ATP diphosphatase [Roseomonas sp.]